MNDSPTPENQMVSPTSSVGEPAAVTPGPQTSQPEPAKKRFSISKKWALIVIAAIILLGGGAAGAYYGYVLPNKPNNVVYKALSNFVSSTGTDRSFNFTDSTTSKDNSSGGAFTVAVTGGMDSDSNIRADAQFDYSVFKVSASSIIRIRDKEMYVKVNELPSLLQLYGNSLPGMDQLAQKLNNNWLRLNVDDVKNAGLINQKQADNANKCVNALSDYITSQRGTIGNTIANTYKQHQFLNATKVGNETVDGTATTKYSLSIDKSQANGFFKALNTSLSSSANPVDKACGSSTDTSSTDQQIQNTDINNLFVWVDGNKNLKKVSATVSDKSTSSNISATFGNKHVDTAKPTNVITIKDLQAQLNQLLGGSNIQSLGGGSLSI